MKINVRTLDIKHGERGMKTTCPIALAVRRLPNVLDCHVWPTWLEIFYPDVRQVCDLPDKARKFVRDFDESLPVQPFKFSCICKEVEHK